MNAFSLLRATEYIGAKELRVHLDKVLHSSNPYRVMLHNRPAAVILPDDQFLQLLEILEELKDSGLLEAASKRLNRENKKKHAWFWLEAWQRGERQADREIKSGGLKQAKSARELIKILNK